MTRTVVGVDTALRISYIEYTNCLTHYTISLSGIFLSFASNYESMNINSVLRAVNG